MVCAELQPVIYVLYATCPIENIYTESRNERKQCVDRASGHVLLKSYFLRILSLHAVCRRRILIQQASFSKVDDRFKDLVIFLVPLLFHKLEKI